MLSTKKLSFNEFAKESGFTRGAIFRIVNDKKGFGTSRLASIKNSFPELSLEWLITGEGVMTLEDQFINPLNSNESESDF